MKWKSKLKFAAIFVFAAAIAFASSANAATYYVRKEATVGTGTGSWANASNDVRSILDGAGTGDTIYVASGDYSPGVLSADTFTLKKGLSSTADSQIPETQRLPTATSPNT